LRKLAVVAAVLAVLGVAGVLSFGPLVDFVVRARARSLGIAIESAKIDVGLGWVRLRDARFGLVGVRGVRGQLQRATVELAWLTPRRVEARGVSVALECTPSDLALDLGEWAKDHPEAFRAQALAVNVDIGWRDGPGGKPWLAIAGASVMPGAGGGGRLVAESASVAGARVGKVGVAWNGDSAAVSLGFGKDDLARAPVRLEVRHAARPITARVTLAPTPIGELAAPLGVALPLRGMSAEGSADLVLSPKGMRGPIEGSVRMVLHGYVPPHPAELDGIVFGDRTSFETKVRVAEDRKSVVLSGTSIAAGAFKLSGSGSIERRETFALVALTLGGAIPCAALARSAATAHLGNVVGGLVGDVSSRTLGGVVNVGVQVNADTRNLPTAQVKHSVAIGCRVMGL
jgi:hypothetical protein